MPLSGLLEESVPIAVLRAFLMSLSFTGVSAPRAVSTADFTAANESTSFTSLSTLAATLGSRSGRMLPRALPAVSTAATTSETLSSSWSTFVVTVAGLASAMSMCSGADAGLPLRRPLFRRGKGVSDKCTWCYHRITGNLEPACVEVCPVGARVFGDTRRQAESDQPVHSQQPRSGAEARIGQCAQRLLCRVSIRK